MPDKDVGRDLVTSLAFCGVGVWLLWDWLRQPGETRPFWIALAFAAVVAVITFVLANRGTQAVSFPQGMVGTVVLAVGASCFAMRWWFGLPPVVAVALVVGALGVFLGWSASDVRDLMRR